MIGMHENFPVHHHYSPKTVRSNPISPRSVDSSESSCSNERTEDNMSDNSTTHSVEPFVKIRSRSSEHISPTDLASYEINSSLQRSFSLDNAQRKRSESPYQATSPSKTFSDPSQTSPNKAFVVSSSAYETMNGNCAKNMVAMAADMGLPTMIPTTALITPTISPPMEIQQQFRLQSSSFPEKKKTEVAPSRSPNSFNTAARGIIGSCRGNARSTGSPSAEDRAQYKRPPHTYPALIASAILDSPGHLITLRGIYDYIMNHFPYYKYCHDKSAWQNSIRHNLSLNQCFVKVPRYENAAKSNYWTMTREGFEEFGNENSFKRRRRRGAALAPISAYKAKKYQNEAKNNKNKTDARMHSTNPSSTGTSGSVEKYPIPFPSQLMGLAGSWAPGLQAEGDSVKSRKRSQSPMGKEESKHPRMLILKQGEGPSLGGISVEDQNRPKSLSSMEEMHGTLNSFNKSLLDSSVLASTAPQVFNATSQSWISEAQKTLMASSGIFLPPLISTDHRSSSPEKSSQTNSKSDENFNGNGAAIMMEGIRIGSELTLRYDEADVATRHFRCHFCPYTYVSTTGDHLEQHVRMFHQLDVTNTKAKAVAAAALTKTQVNRISAENPKDTQERLFSLQNMVSSLSSRSMMAARQSGAQSLLAAAQASASSGATGYSYSGNLSSGILDESVMRSIAEQVTASQANAVKSDREKEISHNAETYAFHRQQAINNAIQQAAGVSPSSASSQDQLRLFYQQLALPNPFLGNPTNPLTAAFPRSMPNSSNQQLWQYQQKLYNHMKALSDESSRDDVANHSRQNSLSDDVTVSRQNSSSSCKSSSSNVDVESDAKKNIHRWKQCVHCDFTAKGDHGLELHYRKVHSQAKDEAASQSSPNLEITGKEFSSSDDVSQSKACVKTNYEEQCDSPLTSSAYPTPPLSNSPSYAKRNFAPLDLSGVKEEELRRSSSTSMTTASTQTTSATTEASKDSKTCRHCDIIFGDEMMHALHMSCHDKNDPFKCTICGQMCNEKYYFNVHLLRGLHQTNDNNNTTSLSKPDLLPEDALNRDNVANNASRRQSNNSDASSMTCRGRLNSDNSEIVSLQ